MEVKNKKELYFEANGLYAYTAHLAGGDAYILVEAPVCNQSGEDVDVWVDIHMHRLTDTGRRQIGEEPGVKAAGAAKLTVFAGTVQTARTQICLEKADIWQPDAPALYVVEAVLYRAVGEGEALANPGLLAGLALQQPHAMKMLDFAETRFGVRTMTLDAKNGFCINGTGVKLSGCAGAFPQKRTRAADGAKEDGEAAFLAEYEAVGTYKKAGCNAVCVQGKECPDDFWDACNRLGLLVLCAVSDAEDVKRCRSFPCVAAWLAGQMRAEEIRLLDASRFVGGTADSSFGMQEGRAFDRMLWNERTEALFAQWDFACYPPEQMEYREAHAYFPNRVILATGTKDGGKSEAAEYPYVIGAV